MDISRPQPQALVSALCEDTVHSHRPQPRNETRCAMGGCPILITHPGSVPTAEGGLKFTCGIQIFADSLKCEAFFVGRDGFLASGRGISSRQQHYPHSTGPLGSAFQLCFWMGPPTGQTRETPVFIFLYLAALFD